MTLAVGDAEYSPLCAGAEAKCRWVEARKNILTLARTELFQYRY